MIQKAKREAAWSVTKKISESYNCYLFRVLCFYLLFKLRLICYFSLPLPFCFTIRFCRLPNDAIRSTVTVTVETESTTRRLSDSRRSRWTVEKNCHGPLADEMTETRNTYIDTVDLAWSGLPHWTSTIRHRNDNDVSLPAEHRGRPSWYLISSRDSGFTELHSLG